MRIFTNDWSTFLTCLCLITHLAENQATNGIDDTEQPVNIRLRNMTQSNEELTFEDDTMDKDASVQKLRQTAQVSESSRTMHC